MEFGRSACVVVALDAHRVLVVGGIGGAHGDRHTLAPSEILELSTMAFAPGREVDSRPSGWMHFDVSWLAESSAAMTRTRRTVK
jgi:hypothetical protein